MRVFDAFLNEGINILYRVALGLIKMHHLTLLKLENKDTFLQELDRITFSTFDQDKLMKVGDILRLIRRFPSHST